MSFEPIPGAIDGVVFDFDGTLYAMGPVRRRVIVSLLPSMRRLARYTAVRAAMAGEDHGDREHWLAAALARLDPDPFEQTRWARWIHERYEPTVLHAIARARARPGIAGLLARLRGAGLGLALISDHDRLDQRLAALGLDPGAFDLALEGPTLGAMKPAARLARRVETGLGLPGPRLLVVGDRDFSDQRFAEALRARFLGVSDRRSPPHGFHAWPEVARRLGRLVEERSARA